RLSIPASSPLKQRAATGQSLRQPGESASSSGPGPAAGILSPAEEGEPMAEFHTELTLPNDPAGVGLARAFVRELARLAGFADAEGDALAGGAESACANLCALAFDPGEAATY